MRKKEFVFLIGISENRGKESYKIIIQLERVKRKKEQLTLEQMQILIIEEKYLS